MTTLISPSQEKRKKSELKVKLTMARFLQSTIEEMAVTGRTKGRSESVQEFAKFFEKVPHSLVYTHPHNAHSSNPHTLTDNG